MNKKFPFLIDISLEEYEQSVKKKFVLQYSLANLENSVWYENFLNKIENSINQKYFPVLRISDGEFLFSLGFRFPKFNKKTKLKTYIKSFISAYILGRKTIWFMSGSKGYGYEKYSYFDWRSKRKLFIDSVRKISEEGILAVGFVKQVEPYGEEYHKPMLRWFYYPFYYVYAMLNGIGLKKLVDGRRILIVSSHNLSETLNIENELIKRGAREFFHYKISRTGAMNDVLDVSRLPNNVDIVFVAAGVGSAQIIPQLKFYETCIIDAGYCIDLLANCNLNRSRYFTNPNSLIE